MRCDARRIAFCLVAVGTTAGCRSGPVLPEPGSDNSWQLITTYTVPKGPWHPVRPEIRVALPPGSPAHPAMIARVFPPPAAQIVSTFTDTVRACKPAAACRLIDSSRVRLGANDSIVWYAVSRGSAVTYDLDVTTSDASQETDTSTARPWHKGEDVEVDVDAASNSYRVFGKLDGRPVGFLVKDSLDDSTRTWLKFVGRVDVPRVGPVAQRNYRYRILR
jgi:hypothetical protein